MDKESRRIRDGLDAMCNKYTTEASDNVLKYEEAQFFVKTHGDKSYGRFRGQFRLFFELANKIILGLNYIDKSKWPENRPIQFLFIVNNLRAIHTSTGILLRNNWEESMSVMRAPLEAFFRIVWISANPSRVSAGVAKQKDGGKEFNLTNFIQDDLKLDWKDYQMMSMKAHSNYISVIQDHLSLNEGTYEYPIMLKLKEDKVMFEVCVNYIIFLEILYLKYLVEVLVTDTHEEHLSEELISDARDYVRLKQEMLKTHPKDYWPSVADDIDDIIELIKRCDAGEEFKNIWQNIRERTT